MPHNPSSANRSPGAAGAADAAAAGAVVAGAAGEVAGAVAAAEAVAGPGASVAGVRSNNANQRGSQGRVLRDPACCLVCAAESASNSPYSWPARNGAATVIDVADARMTDHDLRIGLRW